MKPLRGALAGLVALGTLGMSMTVASAETPRVDLSQVHPGESYSQYYYGPGYGYRRGYGGGASVGAGIAGLAAGAIIGGAIASQQPAYGYRGPGTPVGNVYGHDPDWVAYCASKYRSFDPASGTYLARDGNRYACQ